MDGKTSLILIDFMASTMQDKNDRMRGLTQPQPWSCGFQVLFLA